MYSDLCEKLCSKILENKNQHKVAGTKRCLGYFFVLTLAEIWGKKQYVAFMVQEVLPAPFTIFQVV